MAQANTTLPKELVELLDRAAEIGSRLGTPKEVFMTAAWTAFLDAQPGLREELEEHELGERLATMRRRGLIASA